MKTPHWIPAQAQINEAAAFVVATREPDGFRYMKSRGKSPRILRYATYAAAKDAADRANAERRR